MTDSDVSEQVDAEATSTPEAGTKTQTAQTPAAPVKPGTPAAPVTKSTTETKPAGDKPATPVQPAVPETYEFKSPEGKVLTGPVIDAIAKMGKEHGWTQEVAQKQLPILAQAVLDSRTAQQKLWQAELAADKEIGGEKLKENLGIAAKARQAFGGPELDAFLDETGLGDHPVVARLFHKIGKAISPDGFTAGVRMLGRPGQLVNPGDTSATAIGEVFFGGTDKK